MAELAREIKDIDDQIEKALWELEIPNKLDEALKVYQQAEARLANLPIRTGDPDYAGQQRVLAYSLMRQGNILRQMGETEQAAILSKRELSAARLSGDEITLARSLMSNGTNLIVAGKLEQGLSMVEDARRQFERGSSCDHRQGAGWYWILQADLANAGLIKKTPQELIDIATRGLDILLPIENWPGVARLYAARAAAYTKLGEPELAASDQESRKHAEGMVDQAGGGE